MPPSLCRLLNANHCFFNTADYTTTQGYRHRDSKAHRLESRGRGNWESTLRAYRRPPYQQLGFPPDVIGRVKAEARALLDGKK